MSQSTRREEWPRWARRGKLETGTKKENKHPKKRKKNSVHLKVRRLNSPLLYAHTRSTGMYDFDTIFENSIQNFAPLLQMYSYSFTWHYKGTKTKHQKLLMDLPLDLNEATGRTWRKYEDTLRRAYSLCEGWKTYWQQFAHVEHLDVCTLEQISVTIAITWSCAQNWRLRSLPLSYTLGLL